ncbi:peptidoglycan DD-metalloendopeptidase family protein [Sphingomonas panacisoli]|uniref:Peptidoglycan DD-metalloendopeptidase family protein n=1 Tax=Sphingomonas panacisoli TaxID=1813879 RepID=A0A5B8LK73_9SPHN|nr:peptidoglycan DD-metalloendopeptidase family protein [Sphingomonas panacisoli]QDZ08541.1 peptidoglycan DD-metalloendopeptidase family protein [Sphingomonas panacisoli]
MFLRNDHFDQAGGSAARSSELMLVPEPTRLERLRHAIEEIDWTPDLGARIGSRDWFRGAATCTALLCAAWALSPGFARPIVGETPGALKGQAWDNARAQAIAPLAWGADTGQRIAANDLVRPLGETPDRPHLPFSSALSEGDSLAALLRRAGIAKADVAAVTDLVAGTMSLDDIRPGTRIEGVQGPRAKKTDPRPIESLSFQPAFDFRLTITRTANGLSMQRQAISIDDTPLRIQGLAGASLYKSLRAAGVPSTAAADYLKAIATRISVGSEVTAGDPFDIILKQRRAATGEVEIGSILFAGLDMGNRKVQLVKWAGQDSDDTDGGSWYDANGQTRMNGFMGLPVNGRVSSSFGMRMHPILGYVRMHKGMDIACPYGSPVYAVIDGTVNWAGGRAGYGNFIGIQGPGGVGTGYGHLSRVLVRSGQRVSRGELVGYSGNSGLSTGPHLHFETYRYGATVNPRGFSFSSMAALSGSALRAFKAVYAELMAVKPGTTR